MKRNHCFQKNTDTNGFLKAFYYELQPPRPWKKTIVMLVFEDQVKHSAKTPCTAQSAGGGGGWKNYFH